LHIPATVIEVAVGGHVEKGDSYETAAVREVKEETGLDILVTDLHPLKKVKMRVEDPVTGIINNAFMNQYAYLFTGAKDDLRIEAGKNIGFEFWSIEKLLNATDEDKKKFIPRIFSEEYRQFFITIQEMLIKK
jgi:8-oxo-dGTP pyrophosphatase MutT (NUDIX family)